MDLIRAKRGDTFSLTGTRTDSAGNPVSLGGVSIAAQLRRDGVAIDLTTSVVDAGQGTFRLTAPSADTETWTLGIYECDVEFTAGAVVESTETFAVQIVEDVTRAG